MSLSVTSINLPTVEQLNRLQKGGYVLYFRHAEPFPRSGDSQLSPAGNEQAIALGNWFREQKISVHFPVLTSPARRTQQTGIAAFKNIQVEEALYNMNTLFMEHPTGEAQTMKTQLVTLLESKPTNGINRVMIGHQFTFNGQIDPTPYLGMIMLMPKGKAQGYEIVDVFNF